MLHSAASSKTICEPFVSLYPLLVGVETMATRACQRDAAMSFGREQGLSWVESAKRCSFEL